MKPILKAPGTKRFKLKIDILLSTFASKFNIRRYSMVSLSLNGDINLLDLANPSAPSAVLTGHPKMVSSLTVTAAHVYSAGLSGLDGAGSVVCRWSPATGGDGSRAGLSHNPFSLHCSCTNQVYIGMVP